MGKNFRKPKTNKSTRLKEREIPKSTNNYHPLFSFNYLDPEYSIEQCERDEKAQFADTLRRLGSLTWNDLTSTHRHGLGFEKIKKAEIKGRIPSDFNTPDVDFFISFRFCGLKPIVGKREKEIFHIIWVDRNFTLYDHE